MKMKIKCVILALLTSVSVEAITHFVRTESSRTVENQKTEIRWNEDKKENRDDFKGQREVATVSPTTTSAVELVDAKETTTDKTQNPIVVAYFVANLGEKTTERYNGLPVQDIRSFGDYASSYKSYGVQSPLGFDGHLALTKPYTGYRHAPAADYGYGYGLAGYGYSTIGSYGYPVLGKFGRKLRRMRDHLHFWRGVAKRLL